MFTMKYRLKNNAEIFPGLPAIVELEMDGSYRVNRVHLLVGNVRYECEYDPNKDRKEMEALQPKK